MATKICQGKLKSGAKCTKKSYYIQSGKYVCGRHSDKSKRIKLKQTPEEKKEIENQYTRWLEDAERTKQENLSQGKTRGNVICRQMKMMKSCYPEKGYLMVFPNYRHGKRKDGIGYPDLSPMKLGPVDHGQPGICQSLNIENYHQFNKCFKWEYDSKTDKISKDFYDLRDKAYRDPVPHRHKFDRKFIEQQNAGQTNAVNVPLFSVHLDSSGAERRYSYLQSRWFYCHQYEILASKTDAFKELKGKLNEGYNIQIMGFDARHVDDIQKSYLDTRYPFGHELVLHAMLTIDKESEYPWNIFYRQHEHLYIPETNESANTTNTTTTTSTTTSTTSTTTTTQ
eukprot:TRINITY_DN1729_c0_g1_i1.p1 TRINITY_DN1729_c0_g1~~TRINITY_DN1729_c0_g1_i1.p1  ORF type:complete len:339 (+),score=36.46 TRINITY_DN1729_c0_g1_i1:52-1068(+)